jgi:hypothetical protein
MADCPIFGRFTNLRLIRSSNKILRKPSKFSNLFMQVVAQQTDNTNVYRNKCLILIQMVVVLKSFIIEELMMFLSSIF